MGDAYDQAPHDDRFDKWLAKRNKLRAAIKAKYPDIYAWVLLELEERP